MSENQTECKGTKLKTLTPRGMYGAMELVCLTCGEVVSRHDGGVGAADWIKQGGKWQRDHVRAKKKASKQ